MADREGGMAYPSAPVDARTGESLIKGTDNSDEARLWRLRHLEALRLLHDGDEDGYDRIMATL